MKTRDAINDAFSASVVAFLDLAHSEDMDVPGRSEAAEFYKETAAVLAWVLERRDYPQFASVDRLMTRLLQVHDQNKEPRIRNDEVQRAMRAEFREIISGWMLIDGLSDLTDRIELAAEWTKKNRPLQPDEEATIKLMIEAQIARSDPRGED